jgi:hypothetical protein
MTVRIETYSPEHERHNDEALRAMVDEDSWIKAVAAVTAHNLRMSRLADQYDRDPLLPHCEARKWSLVNDHWEGLASVDGFAEPKFAVRRALHRATIVELLNVPAGEFQRGTQEWRCICGHSHAFSNRRWFHPRRDPGGDRG